MSNVPTIAQADNRHVTLLTQSPIEYPDNFSPESTPTPRSLNDPESLPEYPSIQTDRPPVLDLFDRGDFLTVTEAAKRLRERGYFCARNLVKVALDRLCEQDTPIIRCTLRKGKYAEELIYWWIFPFTVGDRVVEMPFKPSQRYGTIEGFQPVNGQSQLQPLIRWQDNSCSFSSDSLLAHAPLTTEPLVTRQTTRSEQQQQRFDKWCKSVLAHVRTKPGLESDRLPTILGLSKSEEKVGKHREVIAHLEREGLIAIEPANKFYPYCRLFLWDDKPKTVTIVNYEAPPVSRAEGELEGIEDVEPPKLKATTIAKIETIRQQLRDALDVLIAVDELFTIKQWRQAAGLSESVFYTYKVHYEDLLEEAKTVIKEHEARQHKQNHAAELEALKAQLQAEYQAQLAELASRNAELEERNKQLRQQLSETALQTSIDASPTSSLDWLNEQCDFWRSKERDLQIELAQLQADLQSVQGNIVACERILAINEVIPCAPETLPEGAIA